MVFPIVVLMVLLVVVVVVVFHDEIFVASVAVRFDAIIGFVRKGSFRSFLNYLETKVY